MAYAFEYDDRKREIRKDVATTVAVWPKVQGANVDVTGTPTFTVYNPSGTAIQSSTSATVTVVGSVDRADCAVSAISTLDENYRLELSFVFGGVTYIDSILFDVVLFPLGDVGISINDLRERRADIDRVLSRFQTLLGLSDVESTAKVFIERGMVQLDQLIRATIQKDAANYGGARYDAAPTRSGYARPYAILSRERLRTVAVPLALNALYKANSQNPGDTGDDPGDTGDASAKLARGFWSDAMSAFELMTPLSYSESSLTPAAELTDATRVFRMRRVQS